MGFPANTDTGLTVNIVQKREGDPSNAEQGEVFIADDGLEYVRVPGDALLLTLRKDVGGQVPTVETFGTEDTVEDAQANAEAVEGEVADEALTEEAAPTFEPGSLGEAVESGETTSLEDEGDLRDAS